MNPAKIIFIPLFGLLVFAVSCGSNTPVSQNSGTYNSGSGGSGSTSPKGGDIIGNQNSPASIFSAPLTTDNYVANAYVFSSLTFGSATTVTVNSLNLYVSNPATITAGLELSLYNETVAGGVTTCNQLLDNAVTLAASTSPAWITSTAGMPITFIDPSNIFLVAHDLVNTIAVGVEYSSSCDAATGDQTGAMPGSFPGTFASDGACYEMYAGVSVP